MHTVRVYRLQPTHNLFQRLKAAQMEAAKVWNQCCELHKEARLSQASWPGRDTLQKATKGGQFALHSQSIQMVVHAFLATIDTTRQLRLTHPLMNMKYPYKSKRFYPVQWPAQAVHKHHGRVILPMGRGQSSIVLHLDLPGDSGACTLVWKNGFELHVCVEVPPAENVPGEVHAAVDLGEIHLAAVATNTGEALVVSGRGIRSLKRQRTQRLGKLTKKQARCKKQSRRWRKFQHAKNTICARTERRVRDMRHKATRKVVDFCVDQRVGSLFIGNPDGVRQKDSGRHHNQRMALWEYGRDIDYLAHKCEQAHIMSFTGSERGISSRCPACGHKHKPKGRRWHCQQCGFTGHRDVVGSVNMHKQAYDEQVMFPRSITYLRPSPSRRQATAPKDPVVGRSSRADAPLASPKDACCLNESMSQPLLAEKVPLGTGYTVDVVQKPMPF